VEIGRELRMGMVRVYLDLNTEIDIAVYVFVFWPQ